MQFQLNCPFKWVSLWEKCHKLTQIRMNSHKCLISKIIFVGFKKSLKATLFLSVCKMLTQRFRPSCSEQKKRFKKNKLHKWSHDLQGSRFSISNITFIEEPAVSAFSDSMPLQPVCIFIYFSFLRFLCPFISPGAGCLRSSGRLFWSFLHIITKAKAALQGSQPQKALTIQQKDEKEKHCYVTLWCCL